MTEEAEVKEFHFLDLLSLHFRAQLDLRFDLRTRGLLALMHQLSGLSILPSPGHFPWPVVEILREELHQQHPWLINLRPVAFVHPEKGWVDWALFWAWADRIQERICTRLAVEPQAFPVRRSDRITATIIIEPGEG